MNYNFSDRVKGLKPSVIREMFKAGGPGVISLAAGNPAAESFPVAQMAQIADEIFANDAAKSLQYSITEGYQPLIDALTARMLKKGNANADDQLVIMSGGQQGIDLTAKAFCNDGDAVIVESPSFIGALNAFRSTGAKLIGVELEDDGISLSGLEKALKENKNVKLIYLIPSFQNPTGLTMSLEKRRGALELAKKYGVVILEDDPYGELRFKGNDIPTIKSLDKDGIVVYCSSLSKILSAGMRIGFLCGNPDIIQRVVILKQSNDVHTNLFFQMLSAKYIEKYGLDDHIADIKKIYLHKSSLMVNAMDELFRKEIVHTDPCGGLFVWVRVPEYLTGGALSKIALQNKVCIVPGSTFMCDPNDDIPAFRVNYSTPSDEQIVTGIERLAGCINPLIK